MNVWLEHINANKRVMYAEILMDPTDVYVQEDFSKRRVFARVSAVRLIVIDCIISLQSKAFFSFVRVIHMYHF